MPSRGWWVGMLIALALCGRAQADTATQTAKKLYQSASRHYDLQEYADALDEFKQAYALKDDPTFLYNIGQCQRLLGEREPAIRSFKMFLTRAPNAPNRADVQARIDTLQGELDAQAQAARRVEVTPQVAPLEVTAAPPPKRTPVYKKWWLWTTVGVVAVGVGLGVGLGLGLNRPHAEAVGNPVTFQ